MWLLALLYIYAYVQHASERLSTPTLVYWYLSGGLAVALSALSRASSSAWIHNCSSSFTYVVRFPTIFLTFRVTHSLATTTCSISCAAKLACRCLLAILISRTDATISLLVTPCSWRMDSRMLRGICNSDRLRAGGLFSSKAMRSYAGRSWKSQPRPTAGPDETHGFILISRECSRIKMDRKETDFLRVRGDSCRADLRELCGEYEGIDRVLWSDLLSVAFVVADAAVGLLNIGREYVRFNGGRWGVLVEVAKGDMFV